MKPENNKKIASVVSNDCWKKLKILSVHREMSLTDLVKDILERSVTGRKFNVEVPEIDNS